MNKNRIQGWRQRTSERLIAKSISTKAVERRSGGCVSTVVRLTLGDLGIVAVLAVETTPRLNWWRRQLTDVEKSAEGIVASDVGQTARQRQSSQVKARTVPQRRLR
jgi:hypothetical protein